MAEVQTPLSTNVSAGAQSSTADKDALIARLDTLLEQYLHTLDQYEKLTQQLSKHLSAGFFSLAQANFHNRSGVHYGRDSYDERVQATRKIVVTEDEACKLHFTTTSTIPSTPPQPKKASTTPTTTASQVETTEEPKRNEAEGVPDTAAEEEPRLDHPTQEDPSAAEELPEEKPPVRDPIRMFGILVPPALRSAQTSFTDAVEGPVVALARVGGELRALEREIGRVRKGVRRA